MAIKNSIMGLALLAAGMSACSSDNEPNVQGTTVETGEPTSFHLVLSQPHTYAPDPNATPEEVAFNSVDVFIYSDDRLVNYQHLDGNDFTGGASTDYIFTSTTPIKTTTGSKDVYAGVNLPDDIVTTIRNSGTVAGLTTATTVSGALLASNTAGFAMFSDKKVNKTFVEDQDQNSVHINVERLVAKVTVQKGEDLSLKVAGGTISDLQFAMRNSNKLVYALQKKVGNVVYDPNWDRYAANEFDQETNYVDVNEASTGVLSLNNKYAIENTSELHMEKETTYASIRAKFVPEKVYDENGQVKANMTGSTFYTVVDDELNILFFDDQAEADTYASAIGSTVSAPYTDGYCYYNMFINPRDGYNMKRNTYYKTTINSIVGLGNPKPGDDGDTDKPVETPTNIFVTIEIVEWTLVNDSYDL